MSNRLPASLRPFLGQIKTALYFFRFRPDRAVRLVKKRQAALKPAPETLVELPIPGAKVLVRAGTHDIDIFEQIFLMRDCAAPSTIHPELIIDGGAHIGCSAIWFALAFPNARIIAVEADKNNYDLLKRNVSAFKNITCVHGAIWGASGPVAIANPDQDPWGFTVRSVTDTSQASAIMGITIGDLLASSGENRIGLLKLDIEGAEREVFASRYESWLSATDAIMIELHDRYQPGCTESFFAAVNRFGFIPVKQSQHNVTVVRSAKSHSTGPRQIEPASRAE
jgi:FkbM family methyltransferase